MANALQPGDGMLRTFDIPVTWVELAKKTLAEIGQDDVMGLAAQLSYYFLLALVPAIVCVLAMTSFLPTTYLQDMIAGLSEFAPPDVVEILRDQLANIANGSNSGVLTFGLVMALWSSSAAMVGITSSLNRAYDIEEARPWWKVRLISMALTIGVAVFVVLSFGLVMLGPTLADRVAAVVGFGPAFAMAWKVLQWPLVFAMIAGGIGLIYYFAPDAEQDWEWITPGALAATVLWLIASLAFKFYLANFADYNESYGSLGGVIVLMLWFYISALAVLVGAEMNAEIEHASPHGKDPGEKVPNEKKKLGARAARAFEERKRSGGKPSVPAVAEPARRPIAAYAALGVGLIAAALKARGTADRAHHVRRALPGRDREDP